MTRTWSLQLLRSYYQNAYKEQFTDAENFPISVGQAEYLLGILRQFKLSRVMQLGAGYSTLALGFWASQEDAEIVSYADGAYWRDFMSEMVEEAFGSGTAAKIKFRPLSQVSEAEPDGSFDLALVGQGPSKNKRIEDIPWIVSSIREGGFALFDDFSSRTRFANQVTRAALASGCQSVQWAEPDAYRTFGVARRGAVQ